MTKEELDDQTVRLLFALRDSLTDVSPLDYWSGRAYSAITTAFAGADDAAEAISIACRKLQIESLDKNSSAEIVKIVESMRGDYQQWASHIDRNLVYIIALARVRNRAAKQKTAATQKTNGADAWASTELIGE